MIRENKTIHILREGSTSYADKLWTDSTMFEFHDFTDTSSNPKICAKTRSMMFANTYSIIKNVRLYLYTWNMIKIGMWHLLHVCRSNNLAHVSMFCPPLTLDPIVSLLGKMNKNIQPFWLSTRYYFFCHKFRIFT